MKTMKNKILLAVAFAFSAALNIHAEYDPSVGRWASRDPIGEQGGQNIYAFVGNNGLSYIDALGLAKLRFEVVVGVYSPFSGSGKWSQPFWAGDGDYHIEPNWAWSMVSLNNAWSIWDLTHYSIDYCNTVQQPGSPIGTKADAGTIRVYAEDDCGGDFDIFGIYTATLTGSGPNPGYGYAVLKVDGSVISSVTITPASPIASPFAFIVKKIHLDAKNERMIAEYRPTLGLKNRDLFGGTPAYVNMSAILSMDIK